MNIESNRIATITRLAEKAQRLGRTALMKYCYFLQTLRRVPLGYSFSLYSYGPFDSDVLADLDSTEAVGGIKTDVVYYSGGYGYRIEPGPRPAAAKKWGMSFLDEHEADIDWVLAQFGNLGSAQLELASTIIYSDREANARSEAITVDQLTQRVQAVKPHFSNTQIRNMVLDLNGRGFLKSPPKAAQI
jgi:uncharacterized protein